VIGFGHASKADSAPLCSCPQVKDRGAPVVRASASTTRAAVSTTQQLTSVGAALFCTYLELAAKAALARVTFAKMSEAPMLGPTVGSGLIISWAGMRGIVTLAAALALPEGFPSRDLIVLSAFCVVMGTLVIQGLTLKIPLRALNLQGGDPVADEVRFARERILAAVFAVMPRETSPAVELVRTDFKVRLGSAPDIRDTSESWSFGYEAIRRTALRAARQDLLAMRDTATSATTPSTRSRTIWTGWSRASLEREGYASGIEDRRMSDGYRAKVSPAACGRVAPAAIRDPKAVQQRLQPVADGAGLLVSDDDFKRVRDCIQAGKEPGTSW